jgi:hypothetical protein
MKLQPIAQSVRDVVERARAGDQVAMGILAETRDNAKNGVPMAVISSKLIRQYIKKNPPGQFGADETSDPAALRALWQATPDQLSEVFAKASPHVKPWHAVMVVVHRVDLREETPFKASGKTKGRIGGIVRKAFKIQRLRDRSFPLSSYCPVTGWEHGE